MEFAFDGYFEEVEIKLSAANLLHHNYSDMYYCRIEFLI